MNAAQCTPAATRPAIAPDRHVFVLITLPPGGSRQVSRRKSSLRGRGALGRNDPSRTRIEAALTISGARGPHIRGQFRL
jgi:hypothetical protein